MISSLTKIYRSLYSAQKDKGYLTYEQARRQIQSTPGIILESGTTFREIIGKLEAIKLATVDENKQRVSMLPFTK